MALNKHDSQLADKNDKPMIGERQPQITRPAAVGTDGANMLAPLQAVIDALRAHGLIEDGNP